MSKQIYLGANVEAQTDSFAGWIDKTNQLRYDMGTVVVTVTPLSGVEPDISNGGLTVGNAFLNGMFMANTMIASDELRGGTVLNSATMSITSNVYFSDSETVWIQSNTALLDVDADQVNITSHVNFTGSDHLIDIDVANTTISGGEFFVETDTFMTGSNTVIDGVSFFARSDIEFTGNTFLMDVGTVTVGTSGTQDLVVESTADFNANVNIDGITTHTADAKFSDNVKASFGAGNDLQIYHNGTNSIIADTGSGNLSLQTNGLEIAIWDAANGQYMADFNVGGEVDLYYDGNKKFATTSTGVDVTGEVALKTSGTNQLVSESATTAYQQLDFKLRTSDSNERTPLILTTSNTVIAGANTTYDLGSTATNWRHVYAKDTTTANSAIVQNVLTVNAQANVASLMVRDLTPTRIPFVGTGGEIVDDADMTFSGSTLTVTDIQVDNTLNNDGHATLDLLTVDDLSIFNANVQINASANVTGNFDVDGIAELDVVNVDGVATFNANAHFKDDVHVDGGFISLENQKHWITANDGGGNFNIRVGSEYVSGSSEVSTEDGYTFHQEFDQINGTWKLAVSNTSTTVGDSIANGDFTWRTNLIASYENVTLRWNAGDRLKTSSDGVQLLGTSRITSDGGMVRVGSNTTFEDDVVFNNGTVTTVGGDLYVNTDVYSVGSTINFQANVVNEQTALVRGDFTVDGYVTLGAVAATTTVRGDATFNQDVNVTGDVDVTGLLDVTANTHLKADLEVDLDARFNQHVTLGNGSLDNINIPGRIASPIIPNANATYNLGSSGFNWDNVYADQFVGNMDWSYLQNVPDPEITVTLSGDVAGSASGTLTNLATSPTIAIAATIQPNSVALGTDTTGNYTRTVQAGSGIVVANTTGEGKDPIISHSDTSSVSDVASDNDGLTVIQDINLTFDTFGHVTGATVATADLSAGVGAAGVFNKDQSDARYARIDASAPQIISANTTFTGSITKFVANNDPQGEVRFGRSSNQWIEFHGESAGNIISSVSGPTNKKKLVLRVYDNISVASANSHSITLDATGVLNLNSADIPDAGFITATSFTGDGASVTNVDAEFLDGQDGSYYLDYGNFTNVPPTPNTAITVQGTGKLGGSGVFGLSQSNAETISITHDTSAFANVSLTGGTVLSGISQDGFGHIDSVTTVNLDSRYYTESESDSRFVRTGASSTISGTLTVEQGLTVGQNGGGDSEIGFYDDNSNTIRSLMWDDSGEGFSVEDNSGVMRILYHEGNLPPAATVNDGAVTVNTGGGLSGSGTFTMNQSNSETITLSHADTSSQASVTNTSGSGQVIRSISLDGYGHITSIVEEDLDNNFFRHTGGTVSGATTFGDNVTIEGDLLVTGNTVTYNVEQLRIDDPIIVVGAGQAAPALDLGILLQRDNDTAQNDNAIFLWDESADKFRWGLTNNTGDDTSITMSTEYFSANSTVLTAGAFSGNGSSLTNLNASNISSGTISDARLPGSITSDITGNAATATQLAAARDITLGGDLSGSASFDGSSNVTITATVGSNAVALGTNTTGNYVATVASGTGMSVSGSGTETAAVTVAHADTSTLTGSYGQTGTANGVYVKSITVDGMGHLTAVTTDDFDSRYLGISAKAADADLLDGINSGSFIRSDVDDTVTAHIEWQDSYQARFGNGADMEIHHTSGQNYIDINTGNFTIRDGTTSRFFINRSSGDITTTGTFNGRNVSVDGSKLDGIESGAEVNDTASEILTKLLTVDGASSNIDADKLDGQHGSYYRNATNLNSGTISDARLPATISSDITGNAATATTATSATSATTATRLATARNISLGGDVSGSASFDGSSNVTITATVTDDSHNHNHSDGDFTVNGNLYVNDFIYHNGDTNSYMRFSAGDDYQLVVGGRTVLDIDEGTDPDILSIMENVTIDNSGNLTAAGDINSTSDIRAKTDIRDIDGALDIVLQLEGKRFKKNGVDSVGVIAQQVEEVLPEVVHTPEDPEEMKSVAYANMVGVLIEAMKDQQKIIDELSARVERMEKK